MNLLDQKCVPCEGGVEPINKIDAELMISENIPDWKLCDEGKCVSKEFIFKDFKEALEFVNKVGDIAESEQHHPDIKIYEYNKVSIKLSTHSIGGLSQNDFIVAVKINAIK